MASAQSIGLTQRPGYTTRPTATGSYGANYPTLPTLPELPTLERDASTPNFLNRQLVSNQLGALSAQQNTAFTGARANAKQALAGYGGYRFREDDPNTPQREDLLLEYDPNAGMGEREKASYRGQRDAANAAGALESTFANQNIAAAVQRTSLEAQAIANQYAAQVNDIATNYANQGASLIGQFAGYYGQDAAWLIDNPLPAPINPDPAQQQPGPNATEARNDPTLNPNAPPKNNLTYSDFLKGRKSTPALARQWDAQYNYGRRFGGA